MGGGAEAASRKPFDGTIWPWAISRFYEGSSVKVAGCAVGLADASGDLLAKEWRIESCHPGLLADLRPWACPGGHEHGDSLASGLWRTAIYPSFFAALVAQALLE